jgi:hypothetical protein
MKCAKGTALCAVRRGGVCLEVPLQCDCTTLQLHCSVVGVMGLLGICIYMGQFSRVLQTSLHTGWHRETPRLKGRAKKALPFGQSNG